jgi:hypothetical protein
MAKLSGFNEAANEDMNDFSPLPAGDYVGQVIESDVVEPRNGGEMIKLRIKIIAGKYKGRVIFANHLTRHASAQAMEMGWKAWGTLCRAVGLNPKNVNDTEKVHGKPFKVTLTVSKSKDERYGDSNNVQMYKPVSESTEVKPSKTAETDDSDDVQEDTTSTKGTKKKPWDVDED